MAAQDQDTLPSSSAYLGKRLPRGKLLPPYAVEYFNQLVAHYLSLGLADTDPSLSLNRNAQSVADAIIREQDKNRLNWGDLSGLEMALLQLMPESNLQRFAWNLRARYAEIAGPTWAALYEKSSPPQTSVSRATAPQGVSVSILLSGLTTDAGPADAPEAAPAAPAESLRSDLTVLLSELQRLRAVTQVREEQRARIAARSAIGTFGLIMMAILLFFLLPNHQAGLIGPPGGVPSPKGGASSPATLPSSWQIVCFVVAAGAIGGLISMLRRIQTASGAGVALMDTISLDAGEVSVTLSPLYGSVFALALYFLFMGSLMDANIDGMSLFPTFDPTSGMISTYGDFAKLIVWSFIAGFAEKFVPDVLDRLSARSQAAKQAASQATST